MARSSLYAARRTAAATERAIADLAPWFHNLTLDGIPTAPAHPLGDFPSVFFRHFAHAIPADLTGWSVLDIGCNAGFYCFEMRRRGAARVLGVDTDPRYLEQARFAARTLGHQDIEFRQADVFDIATLGARFDLVLFTGVLYHLRHPLLALDLLRRSVVGRLLVFQTMMRGATEVPALAEDYAFTDAAPFRQDGYPALHFVEHRYAGDQTNWWIPNRACAEAMLRSAGFTVVSHPDGEVYVCRPDPACAPALPTLFEAQLHD